MCELPSLVPNACAACRHVSGAEVIMAMRPYVRDFPYAWDVLAENLLDPSHVNWSHHGVIGKRCAQLHYRKSTTVT